MGVTRRWNSPQFLSLSQKRTDIIIPCLGGFAKAGVFLTPEYLDLPSYIAVQLLDRTAKNY